MYPRFISNLNIDYYLVYFYSYFIIIFMASVVSFICLMLFGKRSKGRRIYYKDNSYSLNSAYIFQYKI